MAFSIPKLPDSTSVNDTCDAQYTLSSISSLSTNTALFLALGTSTLAFLLGYYSRGVTVSINSNTVPKVFSSSYLSRVYSLITQTFLDQYRNFAELCDGLDATDVLNDSGAEQERKGGEEGEKDVGAPKAVRQEATDYFGPTMSRRRQSNASSITTATSYPSAPKHTSSPVTSYFPPYSPSQTLASPSLSFASPTRSALSSPRIQSPLVSLDEMVFKWADGVVQALTPALDQEMNWTGGVSKIEEVNEDEEGWVLRSPKVLREMYEVFKGEVAHIMTL
ncbi:hypothetical protein BDY19DRAFT_85095 [Irpex rosettiformis]|uniref:Uncharacterized protein n=1 Tax=Irpex rosettiformis TaxID=378272 RepID=A0ACB8U6D6_9APHY|nr:hypothetical protein BDY19DRAFT_85095 [Irpex rosettiformis]